MAVVKRRVLESKVEIKKSYDQALLLALFDSTEKIKEIAVKSINNQTGGGITRRSSVSKRLHTASKEGDPPNTDSGTLVKSIETEIDKARLQGFVGTNLEYGSFLEFGTQDMEARPWLRPASKAAKKDIGRIFKFRTQRRKKK